MAQPPSVPNFSQYNFAIGDDDEAVIKQNGQNAALVSYGQGLAAFGQAIEQEQEATLASADQIRQQTVEAGNAAVSQIATVRDEAVTTANNAISQITTTKDDAVTTVTALRNEAQAARDATLAAEANAEAIVYGDALGDLQAVLAGINGGGA